MKLPSITYLAANAKKSLFRFPLTIVAAFISVTASLYMIEYHDDISNQFPYINILLTAALGIPLYFSVSVISTKYKLDLKWSLISLLGATIFLALIYFSLPNSSTTHNTSLPYVRYGIFNIIIHLFVSFIPYINNGKLNGFWNYNKTLFIRVWVSLLYSAFLYVGLILALTSLDLLFKIDIHEELYFEFFVVIIGLFNTWFFVSGIPEDLDELESVNTYPKGLKIFSQYILLPLLLLYMVILYVYGGKIIIQWEWPKGIVSYLISCVSILGILTLLLIHPYGNLKENSWIKKFSNIYYPSLFPLIIILFIAIWIRVDDYGITINRYVIILLGIWLTIIAIFFTIRKSNIKFIPMSLAAILLLMSFGPWSMYSVGEKSQSQRLKEILLESTILRDGKINNELKWEVDSLPSLYSFDTPTNDDLLNDSIHNEVKSILDYLDDHHGFSSIQPLFQQNIDSLISVAVDSNKHINEARIYMRSLGLDYKHIYNYKSSTFFNYSTTSNNSLPVTDYDILCTFDRFSSRSNKTVFTLNGIKYTYEGFSKENQQFILGSINDTIKFDLKPMLKQLQNEYGNQSEANVPQNKMILYGNSMQFKCKLIINHMNITTQFDTTSITAVNGNLLLKNKKP